MLPKVGERVKIDGIPNTDGGQYQWRCTRVELEGAPGGGSGPPVSGWDVTSKFLLTGKNGGPKNPYTVSLVRPTAHDACSAGLTLAGKRL